jgi:biopolymer transport protein ExbB
MNLKTKSLRLCASAVLFAFAFSGTANAWWNKEWSIRKKLTIDTSAEGGAISGPIGSGTVLVRLHDGNFQFVAAKEDGSDIRFVAGDDKTPLEYHIEKYDGLLNEAFVWVKVPEVKPDGLTDVWLYYGNAKAAYDGDPKASYDGDTLAVYHFGEKGAPAADSSALANNAENAGIQSEGAMIGAGLRLDGTTAITIPASASLKLNPGDDLTWSAWIKPAALQPNAAIYSRKDGANSFVIGIDNGVPFVEINGQKSKAGAALAAGAWKHLAIVADDAKVVLYVDGESYATLATPLPALNGPSVLGGPSGFAGEIDELEISRAAKSTGYVKFESLLGGPNAAKLIKEGEDEGGTSDGAASHILEHLSLFGDIAKNMMFDGWVVIFVCIIMVIVGWTVAIGKFFYLRKIEKGGAEFLRQWEQVATDLTVLESKNLGEEDEDSEAQELMKQSPLYHIYHIGSAEIRNRLQSARFSANGLSGRSIQAIRASLEGGLTREVQKLNNKMVFLTISIAGGPYVGLLGTVMGVMITFAVIAKTGEVEVNSIAPGIASALLATVAGLVVAIPALFVYSYLNSRIKEVATNMHLFIEEFVTKMAEFYPAPVGSERAVIEAEEAD